MKLAPGRDHILNVTYQVPKAIGLLFQRIRYFKGYGCGGLDLWNLFIGIGSLGLTYQVRIKTLASTVFKKSTFQKFSYLNALGKKFDLNVM